MGKTLDELCDEIVKGKFKMNNNDRSEVLRIHPIFNGTFNVKCDDSVIHSVDITFNSKQIWNVRVAKELRFGYHTYYIAQRDVVSINMNPVEFREIFGNYEIEW